MLLTRPCVNFEKVLQKNGPPRIISEIRKTEVGLHREGSRTRLTGDLLVKCANEQQWWPRKVTIRGGQLQVGCAHHGEVKPNNLRIPLRRLSLSAGSLANSLTLIRGQNVILTIQASSERAFDLWVKAIAIELIRQTPLEDIKYFDILTLNDCWNRKNDQEKDWNFNCLKENITDHCQTCNLAYQSLIQSREQRQFRRPPEAEIPKYLQVPQSTCKVLLRVRSRSCNSTPNDKKYICDVNSNYVEPSQMDDRAANTTDSKAVEILLKKCQNPESYVPVKEKLFLFETLCSLGRKVRSTENVSLKVAVGTKRARSLHDLHSFSSTGVREICKYFENKTEEYNNDTTKSKRLINSDSSLNMLKRVKSLRNLQNASYA